MTLLTRIPLYPLLFAAYAVLFLYAANLALVLPVDAAAPLARAVTVAGMLWAVAAVILRDWRRGAIVATAAVVAFFAYGHVSGGLSARGLDDRAQLALWGLVFVAALVYAIRARGSLPVGDGGAERVRDRPDRVRRDLDRALRAGSRRADADRPRARGPRQRDHAHDARHLLPDLRPLRVGGVDRPPVRHHGQRPVRLAARARLPGARPQPRQLPGHRLLARRDAQHALPGRAHADDRPRLGRPHAGTGDVQGPRGRRVPQGGGLPLLPAGLLVRTDAVDPARGREPRARRHERVRDGPQRHHDGAGDRPRARADDARADVPRPASRGHPVRAAPAGARRDRARTEVRVRAHPPAPRPVRVQGGRLAAGARRRRRPPTSGRCTRPISRSPTRQIKRHRGRPPRRPRGDPARS